MTPEGKILAYAKRQARLLGMIPLRFSARRGVEVGWPDLIVLAQNGRTLFLEVKADGGKPSGIQEARLKQLHHYGHRARVAVGKDGVDAALLEFCDA